MLMPGRHGYASQDGWATGEGENGLPGSLSLDERSNNTPAEYVASQQIEFIDGFESELGDVFEAFITDGSGGGSGSGMEGSDGGYRYGFNGKENDNEVKGEGNQQDYGMRIYDPRLGKFLSVDPLQADYPYLTPYQFSGNSPIANIDLDGLENYYYIYSWNEKLGRPVFDKLVTQTNEKGFWNDVKDSWNETYGGGKISYERKAEYDGDAIKGVHVFTILRTPGGNEISFSSASEMYAGQIDIKKFDQEMEKLKLQQVTIILAGSIIASNIQSSLQSFGVNPTQASVAAEEMMLSEKAPLQTKKTQTSPSATTNSQSAAVNNGNAEAANANNSANLTFTYEGKTYAVKALGPYQRPSNATTPAQRNAVNQPGAKCITCGTTQGPFNADHKTPLAIEQLSTGTIDKKKMRSTDATQPQCQGCSNAQGGEVRKAIKNVQEQLKKKQNGQK